MQITILDGALGTALENELGPSIGQSSLWSTQAVIDHPEAVVHTHLAYLQAGAAIIETATYQADVSNLMAAGLTNTEAENTMRKAVELAQHAQTIAPPGKKPRIALSLGPFGATLRPTQEFLGYYPLPYGPQGFSESGPNTREFQTLEDEQAAVDALARFHFRRLLVYSSDQALWDAIDYIAFETVLLEREVKGIRKAMVLLKEKLSRGGQDLTKRWWISFVCPTATDIRNIDNLARAAIHDDSEKHLHLDGIGVNCTSIQHLTPCLMQLNKAVPRSLASSMFLVFYPNGGEYDTENGRWRPRGERDADVWAAQFATFLRSLDCGSGGRWNGVVGGGCCRTDPPFIEKLHQEAMSGSEG